MVAIYCRNGNRRIRVAVAKGLPNPRDAARGASRKGGGPAGGTGSGSDAAREGRARGRHSAAQPAARTRLDGLAELARARGVSPAPVKVGKRTLAVLDPIVTTPLRASRGVRGRGVPVVEGRVDGQRALSSAEARALKTRVGVGARYRVVVDVADGETLAHVHPRCGWTRSSRGRCRRRWGSACAWWWPLRVVGKNDVRAVVLFASARKRAVGAGGGGDDGRVRQDSPARCGLPPGGVYAGDVLRAAAIGLGFAGAAVRLRGASRGRARLDEQLRDSGPLPGARRRPRLLPAPAGRRSASTLTGIPRDPTANRRSRAAFFEARSWRSPTPLFGPTCRARRSWISPGSRGDFGKEIAVHDALRRRNRSRAL